MKQIKVNLPAHDAVKSMVLRLCVPMPVPGAPQWYGAGKIVAEPGSGKTAVADQLEQGLTGKRIIITPCTSVHRPTSFLRELLQNLGCEEKRNDGQYLMRRVGSVLYQPEHYNVGTAKTVLWFDDIQELIYGDKSCLPLIKSIINLGCCPVVMAGHPEAFRTLISDRETSDFIWRLRDEVIIDPLEPAQFFAFLQEITDLEYTKEAKEALYKKTGGRVGLVVNCISLLEQLKNNRVKLVEAAHVESYCGFIINKAPVRR